MNENLKPCPFCGTKNVTYNFYNCGIGNVSVELVRVQCKGCNSSSDWFTREEQAAAHWNRREQYYLVSPNEGLQRLLFEQDCPNCRSKHYAEILINQNGLYLVKCRICGQETHAFREPDSAVDAWRLLNRETKGEDN